jgi:hypothetical protein
VYVPERAALLIGNVARNLKCFPTVQCEILIVDTKLGSFAEPYDRDEKAPVLNRLNQDLFGWRFADDLIEPISIGKSRPVSRGITTPGPRASWWVYDETYAHILDRPAQGVTDPPPDSEVFIIGVEDTARYQDQYGE